MITVSLPYPPSANRIWRNVPGKTLKSAEYRQWLLDALVAIPQEARGKVKGRCSVEIVADRPDRRARDIDNLAKPILDALKTHEVKGVIIPGVIEDDSFVAPLSLDWTSDEPTKGARVHVTIKKA